MRRTLFAFLSALALIATGVVGAVAVGGTGVVDPPPRIAFLANGIVPADALAAGGIAGQLGAPLFTTRADSLNDDARDGIKAYAPELVIALGGPVAIDDSVLTALSQATGLSVVPSGTPAAGIVRVAGDDRFATARAVAGLLAAYDPAFLPVEATALGAIDAATAEMADDSNLLDGMDSTDFALAATTCVPGEVVTGIAPDGTPTCATPDGGDADTVDGLDGTDLVQRGRYSVTDLDWRARDTAGDVRPSRSGVTLRCCQEVFAVLNFTTEHETAAEPPRLEGFRLCIERGGNRLASLILSVSSLDEASGFRHFAVDFVGLEWTSGDRGCQVFDLATAVEMAPGALASLQLGAEDDTTFDDLLISDTTFFLDRTANGSRGTPD